ncbi:MAG: VWA domain-containing protein [Kofleriaceae bacterium]|nr:VWA domain-containing protein [Kofleriaceae bacterium]
MKLSVLCKGPEEDGSILLLIRLSAAVLPTEERRPVNLCLAIDRSSSMRGPRIEQAKHAARELIGRLGTQDRLSIISFDAAPSLLCPPGPVSDERKEEMLAVVDQLTTGVGTNLAAAVRLATKQIQSSFVRNSISRVLLLTDGQASVGITDKSKLCAISEAVFQAGVTLTTMGLGQGFDDELLMEMAQQGHGGYYYLAAPEDIPAAFGRELEGVFSISAQNTELKLLPHPDIDSVELLHSLPSRPFPDGLSIQVGDLSSGAPRQILVRLHQQPSSESTSAGRITLTYDDAQGQSRDAHIVGIPLRQTLDPKDLHDIVAEDLSLRVASAVDRAWAKRTSGSSGDALLALRDIHQVIIAAQADSQCNEKVAQALLADLARAEIAIDEGAAERENARRAMRQKSQLTQLGHSVLYQLDDND